MVHEETFHCKACGNCCRVSGYVHLDDKEIYQIATFLKISKRECVDTYTQLVRTRAGLSLIEKENGSCIFLEKNTCAIYPVRPWQCQTFPFKWRVSDIEEFCTGWKK